MTPRDDCTPAARLSAWHQDLADARLRRWTYGLYAAFWLLAATIVFPPAPRLVWNASASAPIGLYRIAPGAAVARGDLVLARVPQPMRRFAALRHYLPENVPLVKRVAGAGGDLVCASGRAVTVNGRRAALRLRADGQGRPMPWWQGCRTLKSGEYLLLMTDVPSSFDGRYFGVSRAADMIGRAYPLWTR